MVGLGLAAGVLLLTGPGPVAAEEAALEFGTIRVVIRDLVLDRPADQDVLVDRVTRAAAEFCAVHGPAVTPRQRRMEPRYCPDSVRAEIARALPPEQRRAYDAGLRRARAASRARGDGFNTRDREPTAPM